MKNLSRKKRLKLIRKLHQPVHPSLALCRGCAGPYPCETYQATLANPARPPAGKKTGR